MNRLAFDTATAACSVALERADGETFYSPVDTARIFRQPAHTTELLPAIQSLIEAAELDWSRIDGVVVGVGPGAFTGLRIGVATARAIATSRGIPITSVSSLAALAAAAESNRAVAIVDARRGEYFFRLDDHDSVAPPDQLLDRLTSLEHELHEVTAIGDGAVKLAEQLRERGIEVPDASDPRHAVNATALLRLAESRQPSSADSVVPNYIRAPDATVGKRSRWLVGGSA